jgi:hypothetical protein
MRQSLGIVGIGFVHLQPKVCFITAETIEREVRQIGETQEAARKLEIRTLRSNPVSRCYLECFVIFGVLQCGDYRFGCQPMPNGVTARCLLAGFRPRSSALERIAAIGFDLPVRGHG